MAPAATSASSTFALDFFFPLLPDDDFFSSFAAPPFSFTSKRGWYASREAERDGALSSWEPAEYSARAASANRAVPTGPRGV